MFPTVDVAMKGLELLKQMAPRVSRIAVVWDPRNRALVSVDEQLDKAGRALQIELRRVSVQSASDIPSAFTAITDQHAQALLIHPLPVGPAGVAQVAKFASDNGLPVITWSEPLAVIPGVLFSYGPQLAEVYGRAAGLVDKVLRGAKPADLPVEQPSKFDLVVNLKTARALGLTIPQALLLRADRVIE